MWFSCLLLHKWPPALAGIRGYGDFCNHLLQFFNGAHVQLSSPCRAPIVDIPRSNFCTHQKETTTNSSRLRQFIAVQKATNMTRASQTVSLVLLASSVSSCKPASRALRISTNDALATIDIPAPNPPTNYGLLAHTFNSTTKGAGGDYPCITFLGAHHSGFIPSWETGTRRHDIQRLQRCLYRTYGPDRHSKGGPEGQKCGNRLKALVLPESLHLFCDDCPIGKQCQRRLLSP